MKKSRGGLLLLAGLTFSLTSCRMIGFTSQDPAEQGYVDFICSYLKEHYYIEVDERQLLDGMLYGLTDAFEDPFTYYTSMANGETQDYSSSGVGLGFSRTLYYGEALVAQVMKNSPAEKAGLKEDDILYKVRNVGENAEFYVLKEHSYNDWGNVLTGEAGSSIELYVRRKDEAGVYREIGDPIIVTRGAYNIDKARLLSLTDTEGYSEAYVEITSFLGDESLGESTPQGELQDIFDRQIFNQGIDHLDHLIVDLRGNGGGYVNNCVEALGLFIPLNEVTAYYLYSDGTYTPLKNTTMKVQYTDRIGQITLLIDNGTASAGESFALGLRDSPYTKEKVKIAGQVSYGKGIAQSFLNLFNDGSLIRFTFAKVCSPTKNCINKRGIVPDLFLGEEYIPYDVYQRFIPGVKDNADLSESDASILVGRINALTGKSFSDLSEAISGYREIYGLGTGDRYDSDFADHLADKVYDKIIYSYGANLYTGFVEARENNDYLTSQQRIFIKNQINYLFGTGYGTFDQAVRAFQEEYAIVNEQGIYDKTTADLLQGLLADLHVSIYEDQVLAQVKQAYGSEKI